MLCDIRLCGEYEILNFLLYLKKFIKIIIDLQYYSNKLDFYSFLIKKFI